MDKDIEQHILEWIRNVSKIRTELNGFSICPYASKAKYTIIKCLAEDIVPISGYDVVFYVVEDYFNLNEVEYWVKFYNELYDEWSFFEDCATYDSFINGIQTNNGKYNLILMQNKEDLRKKREVLAQTTYYHQWDEEYLQKILGDDNDLLNNKG